MMIYKILILLQFITLNNASEEMIFVKGGKLKQGKEKIIVKDFYLDKYEVSLKSFASFIECTKYKTEVEIQGVGWAIRNKKWEKVEGVNWRHDMYGEIIDTNKYKFIPVTNITFNDAKAFAQWAGKRLPTKNEWVYAASGGQKSKKFKYSGGNKASKAGWYDDNTYTKIQSIGTKAPNELGFHDMSGNVHEFVQDTADQVFARGGCFFSDKEFMELKDSGWKISKNQSFPTYGFRCAKD